MITEQEFKLIEKRIEAWNEKLRVVCIEFGPFSKDEMINHIKARDEAGKKIAEVQLYYLKKLKERG